MAHGNEESKLDQIELENLQKSISQVEAAKAASTPASRGVLEVFLANARDRVATLEKKIKEAQEKREARAQVEHATVAAQMAEAEAQLDATEKETFCGFLQKAYFTKDDFASLETFYAKTWTRLSENGKDAMSHKIWEGIRRENYTFTELPLAIREKECGRAYKALKTPETENASGVPERDRQDFIRAYEAGERKEAEKILERQEFKQNMFRKESDGTATELKRGILRNAAIKSTSQASASLPDAGKAAEDLSALKFDSLALRESTAGVSPPQINATAGKAGREAGFGVG